MIKEMQDWFNMKMNHHNTLYYWNKDQKPHDHLIDTEKQITIQYSFIMKHSIH